MLCLEDLLFIAPSGQCAEDAAPPEDLRAEAGVCTRSFRPAKASQRMEFARSCGFLTSSCLQSIRSLLLLSSFSPLFRLPSARPFHPSRLHPSSRSSTVGFEASIVVEHDCLLTLSFGFPLDRLKVFVYSITLHFLSANLHVQLTVTLACHLPASDYCLSLCKNRRRYSFQ
jgi:hypothetical protein